MGEFHMVGRGNSGFPLVPDWSAITVSEVPADLLRAGDLVVYSADSGRVCHRLLRVKIIEGRHWFFLRGDANLWADGWVPAQRILGRVISVNGRSLSQRAFRTASRLLFYHAWVQQLLFHLLFLSAAGRCVGRWKARHWTRKPIVTRWFQRLMIPWHKEKKETC
jgi:hypothetical protein